jgi:hypothetical protein
LFQSKELLQLPEHNSIQNEMGMESFMKLCPGHTVINWLCGKKVSPPSSHNTSKLLGCEYWLLVFRAVDKVKLLLHGTKPVICFQMFICPSEY